MEATSRSRIRVTGVSEDDDHERDFMIGEVSSHRCQCHAQLCPKVVD